MTVEHSIVTEVPTLSIVTPMLNEENNVDQLLERLGDTLNNLDLTYEIICIDDGSSDDTCGRLSKAHERDPRVKVIQLSRNFGKEYALFAGLHRSSGRAVVTIDSDLQHPPETIGSMVKEWQKGDEIVFAVRANHSQESIIRRLSSRLYYAIFNSIVDIRIPSGVGDFQLIDRKIVDVLCGMQERNRFTKGLCAWVGFDQGFVTYQVDKRASGRSTWHFWKLLRFSMDGITAFSIVPLRIWTYFGSLVAIAAIIFGLYQVIRTLIFGVDVPGYASLSVSILFIGGVQLITLGVLGGYVGRAYEEGKNRPLYVVKNELGFDE